MLAVLDKLCNVDLPLLLDLQPWSERATIHAQAPHRRCRNETSNRLVWVGPNPAAECAPGGVTILEPGELAAG